MKGSCRLLADGIPCRAHADDFIGVRLDNAFLQTLPLGARQGQHHLPHRLAMAGIEAPEGAHQVKVALAQGWLIGRSDLRRIGLAKTQPFRSGAQPGGQGAQLVLGRHRLTAQPSMRRIHRHIAALVPTIEFPSQFGRAAVVFTGRGQHLAQAAAGKRVEWGQHHVALELGGHAYRRTGGNQYDGGTARATGFLRLSPRTALTAEVSAKTLSYAELPYLTGSMRTLGTTAIHVPEPTRRWEAGLGFTRYQATEAAYTYNQPSATVRAVQEWAGGWISGLRMQALVAAFAASDPFFGEIRRDREIRIEFDLLNRKLKWWSMSPRLLIGFVRRESNLDLYDYKRSYARIGLTREF